MILYLDVRIPRHYVHSYLGIRKLFITIDTVDCNITQIVKDKCKVQMNGNINSVYYKKNNYGAVALYYFEINYLKRKLSHRSILTLMDKI